MKRKIISFFIITLLLLTIITVNAFADGIPTSWKVPGSLTAVVTDQFMFHTSIYFSIDSKFEFY